MTIHRDQATTCDLADAKLDGFEIGLLAVLRHFCASFAEPHLQGWVPGYGLATHLWGISSGPKAAQAVFHVLDAMQRTRVATFQYNNPACRVCSKKLTANERHMMRMLHAVRRGRTAEARIDAMLLVEGADTRTVLAAAYTFGGLFPAAATVERVA